MIWLRFYLLKFGYNSAKKVIVETCITIFSFVGEASILEHIKQHTYFKILAR